MVTAESKQKKKEKKKCQLEKLGESQKENFKTAQKCHFDPIQCTLAENCVALNGDCGILY